MKDFVLHGTLHLIDSKCQKNDRVKIQNILSALKFHSRRTADIKSDFSGHLKQKISEKIVFVFQQS